jgi:hypothetical protein
MSWCCALPDGHIETADRFRLFSAFRPPSDTRDIWRLSAGGDLGTGVPGGPPLHVAEHHGPCPHLNYLFLGLDDSGGLLFDFGPDVYAATDLATRVFDTDDPGSPFTGRRRLAGCGVVERRIEARVAELVSQDLPFLLYWSLDGDPAVREARFRDDELGSVREHIERFLQRAADKDDSDTESTGKNSVTQMIGTPTA